MSGEWIVSDDSGGKTSAPNNNILGHVVHRLLDIVNPPPANTPPPGFPPFPIKGCVLGKIFSGKSNSLKHLAKAFSIHVLCVDTLVEEALQAYQNNEMEQEYSVPAAINQEEPQENQQMIDNVPAESNGPEVQSAESIPAITENDELINEATHHKVQSSTKEDSVEKETKLSARAELGRMVEKYLKRGKAVPDELLVDILVTAIKMHGFLITEDKIKYHTEEPARLSVKGLHTYAFGQTKGIHFVNILGTRRRIQMASLCSANSGWVIDGFPTTLNQAKLIEKALTGCEPDKTATKDKKKMATLVKDPGAPQDPPPPPPALDFVALIEISDNVVLQRAAGLNGQRDGPYNEAGPKGDDHDQKLNQIQHRITGFLDNWQKLEAWFSPQNILIKIDGEVDEDTLYHTMENVYLTSLYNKKNKDNETEKKEEIQPLAVTPPPPLPPPTPPPETMKDPRPPSADKRTSAKKGKGKSKSPKGPVTSHS